MATPSFRLLLIACALGRESNALRVATHRTLRALPKSHRVAATPQASYATTVLAPTLGAGLANAMFFSSLPEVNARRQARDIGNFNPIPCAIALGNTIGWSVYSVLTRNPYVAAANFPGVCLSSYYVLTMCQLMRPGPALRRVEATTLGLIAVHILAAVACAFFLPSKAACIALYGLLNNGILLAYYGAPLSSIKQVFQTRSAESIHRPLVALNGLNALFWSTYAVALKDLYILVPNSIGALLSAVQLALSVAMPASATTAPDEEPAVEEAPATPVAAVA